MNEKRDADDDELTDAALGISPAKAPRGGDGFEGHHNENPWTLLIGVFLAGLACGVALADIVSHL
jgi:hypothetical protein